MIEFYALAAVALLIAGAVVGFVALVCVGIHREERHGTMTVDAPDRVASGARVANGMHARLPGVMYEAAYFRHRQPPIDREY
jgi:hypothetical protein